MEYNCVRINQLLIDKKMTTVSPLLKLQAEDIKDFGNTAVVSQDKQFIIGYTDLIDKKLVNGPFIIFGDHTEIFKYVDFPFIQGADGIKILKADDKNIDSKFLYYALNSCYYPTGFYQRHYKLLKKTYIPDLNIEYQQKVASVLNKYDELIENNNKRIKILEKMAENLYKEWFVRFRFPGHETTEFVNEIPKTWLKSKLKTLLYESGKSIKSNNKNNYEYYLPIELIPNRSMALNEIDNIDNAESSLQSFSVNNILFGAMRSYFHKVIYSPVIGITRSTCLVLSPYNKIYSEYAYLLMYQNSTVDFSSTISVGSTMPYVRWKDFSRMNIVIPAENVVISFNNIIKPILQRIQQFYFENRNLIKQRDALLPRLMSGKLEV